MSQPLTLPAPTGDSTVIERVPGTRLLGRYEGGGYVEDRFLVMRPDGQPVLLDKLPYLVVRFADGVAAASEVAERVSREYGRRLSVELLGRLVRERLAPAGLLVPPNGSAAVVTPRSAGRTPAAGGAVRAPGPAPAGQPAPSGRPGRHEQPLLSVTLGTAFLPTFVVRRLAAALAPLFHPAAVAAVLAAFAAADLWLVRHALGATSQGVDRTAALLADPADLLAVLGLVAISTLVHELGHAAGCRYGGGRPGAIGAGLYLWFVVFWTDVTDAYRLDRPGRLRTDLGGIYFNAVFVVLATPLYALTGWLPLAVAVGLTNMLALQQLLPIIRMDGYYILGDLTGVPNLFGVLRPTLLALIPGRAPDPRVTALRPGVRRLVVVWSLVTTIALGASLVLLVTGAPRLISQTASQIGLLWAAARHSGSWTTTLYAASAITLVSLPFVGFAALVARGVRQAVDRRRPAPRPAATLEEDPVTDVVARPPDRARPSAADFTEELILRHRRQVPRSGWRRQVFLATGGVVHPGPSAAERREAELIARLRTRLDSPRRIVVLSRKGGAGKTTTTLMLGHTLAIHRGDRVVALDANPDAGSLPYRVERESTATVTSLLADVERLTSYAQLRAHTSQAPSRLEIVASDDDPKITHALGQADYARVIRALEQHYMILLMDTGTGILDDATQGLLREADQILVVMPPALDGARVAASTLDWLEEHGYRSLVRGAVAVINGVRSENGLVQLDAVEEHFRARCAGVVQIPWDRALEAGARTALEDLRPATRKAYLELGAVVAEGFADPSGGAR